MAMSGINLYHLAPQFLRSKVLINLLYFSFLTCTNNTFAAPKIVYFYDGDTVKIEDGDTQYKLRITEIDAPERNQRYGLKSRRALMQYCQQAEVSVTLTGKDRYNRTLGQLYCNSRPVALYMVANGHAWSDGRYTKSQSILVAEKNAQQHQLGLWATEQPIAPWIWRKKYQH
jgi:micrococcal nuclease